MGCRLQCYPAGLFAFDPAPDAVCDHHQKGEPLAFPSDALNGGKAGLPDHHLPFQGANEEVVLVVLPDLSRDG